MKSLISRNGSPGTSLPREKLINGMVVAFNGDTDHKYMSRSAPQRLKHALVLTKEAGLSLSRLQEISKTQE